MADPRLRADGDGAGPSPRRGSPRPPPGPPPRRRTVGIGRPGVAAVRDREHGGPRGGLERHGDHPVRNGAERGDLAFALDHQPGRHGLHAPGRASLIDGANEHRETRHPTSLSTKRRVSCARTSPCRARGARNAARMADSVISLKVTRTKRRRAAEELPQVPGDRLALAVAVGREHHRARAPGETAQPRHDVAPVRRHLPGRLPLRLRIETERCAALPPTATHRKIPKVAEARPDEVVLTEAALYRPALGRRLDDDERGHYDPPCTPRTYASAAGNR